MKNVIAKSVVISRGTGSAAKPHFTESPAAERSVKLLRPAQLRKLRDCQQVAAVCYRTGESGIEFLLVETHTGRWTFPKGSTEPGLTHAQAAALEAFEEAGVHGRMEEVSFARYVRGGGGKKIEISAHLCEVLRLVAPQEAGRNPKWFSAAKARRRLREDRSARDGDEMARVVQRAVVRIQQKTREASAASVAKVPKLSDIQKADVQKKDALQRVRFEAFEDAGFAGRMTAGFLASTVAPELEQHFGQIISFPSGKTKRRLAE